MTELLHLLGVKRAHPRAWLPWTAALLTVAPPAGTIPEAVKNGLAYLANMGGVPRGYDEMRTGEAGELTWVGLCVQHMRHPVAINETKCCMLVQVAHG